MGRHGGPLHLLVTLLVAAVALLVAAEAEATLPPPPQASDVDPASPRGPLVIELPYEEGLEDVPAEVRCASWRLAAEANNLAPWRAVPEECADHVRGYVTGAAYRSDLDLVARESAAYARAAAPPCGGDGRDAWVFDVDETLLSNIPYYAEHGFRMGRSELFDQHAFDEWVERGEAPAIPSSLKLYNEVRDLGFKTFLLTGRSEGHRGVTAENLNRQGFHDWDKLILRCIFTRPTEPNTDQWKKDDNDLQWNSNCTKVSKSSVPGYVIPPRTSQMSAFCTNSGYGQQACIAFPSCPESLISDQKVTIKSPSKTIKAKANNFLLNRNLSCNISYKETISIQLEMCSSLFENLEQVRYSRKSTREGTRLHIKLLDHRVRLPSSKHIQQGVLRLQLFMPQW